MGQALAIGALLGAGMGAGTAALTGGDPLKGALMGALGGAIMPGAGGLLGGAEAGAAMGAARGLGGAAARGLGGAAAGETAALGSSRFGQSLWPTVNMARSATNVARIAPETGLMDVFKSTPGGLKFPERLGNYMVQNPLTSAAISSGLINTMANRPNTEMPGSEPYTGSLSRFNYEPSRYNVATLAEGGIADAFQPNMYPQSQISRSEYAVPRQMPIGAEIVRSEDVADGSITSLPSSLRYMGGGRLGGYSDGGRLLKGPGDGMSDSIPAKIGARQPARLADGEFVIPADVVSHLGNGSTDAGAKQLYDMMSKVRKARTGNKKQGREINARKMLPA